MAADQTYTKPAVLPAWGETNMTPFDMVQPDNADIKTGYPLSNTPATRQRWNWILNFCSNAVRYFCQRGIADYDANETYQIGAVCIGDDNLTYKSIVINNTGNKPSTSPTDWVRWGFTVAQLPSAPSPYQYTNQAFATTPDFVVQSNLSARIVFEMTLTGNTNPTMTGQTAGQEITFFFHQDATGGHTVNWPANMIGFSQMNPAASGRWRQSGIIGADTKLYATTPPMTD